SVNLYMFHGGTNFGFMNGCSARGEIDLHQITSYDYDAPLDEQGNPTKKYYALQDMMKEMFPEVEIKEPLVKDTMEIQNIPLKEKVSLFSVIEDIADKKETKYPQSMEELGQEYGYILYRTKAKKDSDDETYRIIDGRDRIQFFFNEEKIATQYQTEIGEKINVAQENDLNQIDILVENMGRVNYGRNLFVDMLHICISTGVILDLHFMLDSEKLSIVFSERLSIDYRNERIENTHRIYTTTLDTEET